MYGVKGDIVPAGPPVEREYNIAEVEALRYLAETCGMYCENLPVEVREALHQVPKIDRQHGHTSVKFVS